MERLIPNPMPVDNWPMQILLQTDRLTLRRFTEEDAHNLLEEPWHVSGNLQPDASPQ
jgi:hypothetical protein